MNLWPFNKKQPEKVARRRLTDESTSEVSDDIRPTEVYRRNRVLRQSDDSSRLKIHSLRTRQRSYGLYILIFLLISSALVWSIYQLSGSVKVAVYGQVVQSDWPQKRYEKPIREYFSKNPLERIRPLADLVNLASFMQQNGFPEVEGVVSITPLRLGASTVTVKVREPVAVWSIAGKTNFVDKHGVIFQTNYFEKPVITISDQSGLTEATKGQVVAVTSGRFLDFIGQAIGKLSESKLAVSEVIIPPNTTRMVEFELTDKTVVKMTVDRPAGEQVEDAERAVSSARARELKLKYVDVRVSGKAFYKLR